MADAEPYGFTIGGEKVIKISIAEMDMLEEHGLTTSRSQHLTIYKNVTVRGVKFSSQQSKEVATIDYFVKLKFSDQICAVKYYTIVNNILHALVRIYEVIDIHEHLTEVRQTDENQLVKMGHIAEKVIYMKFGLREFVVALPNRYEKT